MIIKKLINNICDRSWQTTDMFLKISNQMAQQLSIQYILEKIQFLQSAILSLLNEDQIEAFFLKQKKLILRAQIQRIKLKHSKNIIAQFLQKIELGIDIQQYDNSSKQLHKQSLGMMKVKIIQNIDRHNSNGYLKTDDIQENPYSRESKNDRQEKNTQIDSIKQILFRLISQGKKGDPTSQKILMNTNRKILEGVDEVKQKIQRKLTIQRQLQMQDQIEVEQVVQVDEDDVEVVSVSINDKPFDK